MSMADSRTRNFRKRQDEKPPATAGKLRREAAKENAKEERRGENLVIRYTTPMPSTQIRLAVETDAAAINDIYNHYVLHSTCTYQEQSETLESRREWLTHHGKQHPVLVAILDGNVVGWAAISPFHRRTRFDTRWRTRSTFIRSISARELAGN